MLYIYIYISIYTGVSNKLNNIDSNNGIPISKKYYICIVFFVNCPIVTKNTIYNTSRI